MDTIAFLQQFASPALDQFMLLVSNLGSEYAYIALLVIVYLSVDARVGRRIGLYLLTSYFLNTVLKGVFDTPRPYAIDPSVARSQDAIATGTGPGFPSGHAQASATFWWYLALRVARPWFWVLSVILVGLIAISRLYLGVHLPVDVLGGLALGMLLAGLALLIDAGTRGVRVPAWLMLMLGFGLPLVLVLLVPVPKGAMMFGGFAAFATGPVLVRHEAPQAWWRRTAVALVGLILVFVVLLGSSILLPEAVKDLPLVGFVRYLLIGYAGVVLTPWLVRRAGLIGAGPLVRAPGA
ncbi:MAG TPA: phosphatase PAP2 family protein [Trueperaceae bacterium]